MIKKITLNKPGVKKIRISVAGETLVKGVILGEEKGDYVLDLLVEHKRQDSSGKVVIKGIAKNGANVKVKGKIKIPANCNGVDSFLEIRLLILDDKSSAQADPELEIESNEVKASHAATVSKIDEEEIFYLQSRGVERKKAEGLIVGGFLEL